MKIRASISFIFNKHKSIVSDCLPIEMLLETFAIITFIAVALLPHIVFLAPQKSIP